MSTVSGHSHIDPSTGGLGIAKLLASGLFRAGAMVLAGSGTVDAYYGVSGIMYHGKQFLLKGGVTQYFKQAPAGAAPGGAAAVDPRKVELDDHLNQINTLLWITAAGVGQIGIGLVLNGVNHAIARGDISAFRTHMLSWS